MKSELLHFYKYVDPKNISVVGTPQFEPYVLERYYQSENDFYKQFDLDVLKPIICYSCADSATSQNDNLYIQTIANAILNKKIVKDILINFLTRQ